MPSFYRAAIASTISESPCEAQMMLLWCLYIACFSPTGCAFFCYGKNALETVASRPLCTGLLKKGTCHARNRNRSRSSCFGFSVACSATRLYIRRSSSHDLHAGCFAVAWRLRQVRSLRVVCARLVAVTIAERYLLCADMVYDIAAAI
jgi:hypothetical protein